MMEHQFQGSYGVDAPATARQDEQHCNISQYNIGQHVQFCTLTEALTDSY